MTTDVYGLPWQRSLTTTYCALCLLLLPLSKAEPQPGPLQNQPGPVQPPSGNPRITEHPEDSYFARNEPANLDCKAEGDPPPQITWYRNGKPVETNKNNPMSHRMLMDNGQLFFLRVIHSKNNQPDIGQYYCNATNSHGTAISRTANIQIAVLKDDFRQEPTDSTAAVGQTVVLHCQPPRGKPEPKVLWHKDGEPVELNDRVHVQDTGNLVMTSVIKQDIGKYVCLAINDGGEKRSNPAQLNVLDVPRFKKLPKDTSVEVGKTAEFECEAIGDPPIKIHWSKEDGTISYGRARLDQNNLRIEEVEPEDEGVYVCFAENAAGSTQATARLTVYSSPSIVTRPKDQVVARGRTVSLQCVATGNPSPTVFWRKDNESPRGERVSVAGDGTLRIEAVQESDAGRYNCEALNTQGQASASALVKVIVHDPRPPPIIKLMPKNQTLLINTVAVIRCEGDGDPRPIIRWLKDGRPLIYSSSRFSRLQSGSLQISDLQLTDKGWYSCKAISETGETTRRAYLGVEHDVGQSPERAAPSSYLPDPPTKPVVSDVTDTSAHLSWAPGIQVGRSPVHAFAVEYFGFETTQGWVVASSSVSRESYTVEGLQPNTTYLFMVRAVNNDGIGYPSLVSEAVRTTAKRENPISERELERRLKGAVIELTSTKSVNSSAINLTWKVLKASDVIERFDIEYRLIKNIQRLQYGDKDVERVAAKTRTFLLTGLKSYSWYELCVRAVAKQVTSQCSNLIKVQTEETFKLEAPKEVQIHKESENSISVRWRPPSLSQAPILGYQVLCLSEDKKQNCSTQTDGQTNSVVINKLQEERSYKIQVAALTANGRSYWSDAITAGRNSHSTVKPVTNQETEEMDLFKRPWFIGVLIGTVGVMLWILLCIFSIWLCKRNKKKKKMKDARDPRFYTGVPLHKGDECHRNIVYPPQYGLKDRNVNCNSEMDLPPELHILLPPPGNKDNEEQNIYKMAGDGTLPEMRTFYQKVDPVAPYATTALIQQQNLLKQRQGMDHLFRPINQGYIPHSEGSADSCQKPPLSSDSNHDRSHSTTDHNHSDSMQSPCSDSGSHSTDENGLLIKQKKKNNNNNNTRADSVPKTGKGTGVNWAELLPPPPEHPPPSECGEPPMYTDVHGVERANNQSPMSPVSFSQLSACSCPNPHTQTPVSGWNMPVYSDNDCHRCHSEKYYDPMTYRHDAYIKRTHSPHAQTLKHVNSNKSMHPNSCIHSPRGTPSVNYQYSQPHRGTPSNCANPGDVWSNNFNRASHSSRSDNESPNIVPCFPSLRLSSKAEKDYRFLQENEWGPEPAPPYHSSMPEQEVDMEGQCRDRTYPGNLQEHPAVSYNPRSGMQTSVNMPRNCDSPASEGGDYANDSDLEQPANQNWTADQNTDVSSVRSSTCSSGDGTFLTEEDFASAVARAAAMSGLTVVGTTVVDNKKKERKHRRQARPVSPGYSTDSNYGSIDVVRRPFPKSERKRQLQEQSKVRRGDSPENKQYNPSDITAAMYDSPYGRAIYSPAVPAVPVRLSSLSPNYSPMGRLIYERGHYSSLQAQPVSVPLKEDVV